MFLSNSKLWSIWFWSMAHTCTNILAEHSVSVASCVLTHSRPPSLLKPFSCPGRRGSTRGSCGSSYDPSDPFCLQLVPTMELQYLAPLSLWSLLTWKTHVSKFGCALFCFLLFIWLMEILMYLFFGPYKCQCCSQRVALDKQTQQCWSEKGVNTPLSLILIHWIRWPQSHDLTSFMTLFSLEFCDCVNKDRPNPLSCRSASMGLDGLYNLSWVKSTWTVWGCCILRSIDIWQNV